MKTFILLLVLLIEISNKSNTWTFVFTASSLDPDCIFTGWLSTIHHWTCYETIRFTLACLTWVIVYLPAWSTCMKVVLSISATWLRVVMNDFNEEEIFTSEKHCNFQCKFCLYTSSHHVTENSYLCKNCIICNTILQYKVKPFIS